MSRMLCISAVCCFVCLAVLGCGPGGPELGTVTGKVTLDGKPVTNGLVTFVPEAKGGASIGKTDANGQYELLYLDRKGALIGQHKVTVTTLQEGTAAVTGMRSDSPEYAKQAASSADQSAYNSAKVVEPIPARYNTNTELTQEVKSGINVIDLELKSDG